MVKMFRRTVGGMPYCIFINISRNEVGHISYCASFSTSFRYNTAFFQPRPTSIRIIFLAFSVRPAMALLCSLSSSSFSFWLNLRPIIQAVWISRNRDDRAVALKRGDVPGPPIFNNDSMLCNCPCSSWMSFNNSNTLNVGRSNDVAIRPLTYT